MIGIILYSIPGGRLTSKFDWVHVNNRKQKNSDNFLSIKWIMLQICFQKGSSAVGILWSRFLRTFDILSVLYVRALQRKRRKRPQDIDTTVVRFPTDLSMTLQQNSKEETFGIFRIPWHLSCGPKRVSKLVNFFIYFQKLQNPPSRISRNNPYLFLILRIRKKEFL